MPFKIVRNDITKVKADAIVNTANPKPVHAGGTDSAIYHAAGAEKLLEERKKIGCIERGEVAVTDAFALNAKYIIHTVGPEWVDGKHDEFKLLENCYIHSLEKALELGCESIAFPLISTGVYGFPKDKALQIAVSVFSRFHLENEMQIILVVFDKTSFQLSGQIVGEIDSYIDANYVRKKRIREYSSRSRIGRELRGGSAHEEELYEECCFYDSDIVEAEDKLLAIPPTSANMSLEEELEQLGMSFHEKLFELIDKSTICGEIS